MPSRARASRARRPRPSCVPTRTVDERRDVAASAAPCRQAQHWSYSRGVAARPASGYSSLQDGARLARRHAAGSRRVPQHAMVPRPVTHRVPGRSLRQWRGSVACWLVASWRKDLHEVSSSDAAERGAGAAAHPEASGPPSASGSWTQPMGRGAAFPATTDCRRVLGYRRRNHAAASRAPAAIAPATMRLIGTCR